MLDYFASRENFLDVGEQYANHVGTNIKEWHKFVQFYSDLNNARLEKDEEYKRDQFIGEELDWKMLADNLTLFGSQLGDLKDMQGFDPSDGDNLLMDQSIIVHNDGPDAGGDEIGGDAGYQPPQNLLPPNPDDQEAKGS